MEAKSNEPASTQSGIEHLESAALAYIRQLDVVLSHLEDAIETSKKATDDLEKALPDYAPILKPVVKTSHRFTGKIERLRDDFLTFGPMDVITIRVPWRDKQSGD